MSSGVAARGSPVIVSVNLRVTPRPGVSTGTGAVDQDAVVLSNTWSSLLPGTWARTQHKAVWTGSAVAVWGGLADPNAGPWATGALFDPSSGGWLPMANSFQPSRTGESLVWTGTRLLTWGGQSFGSPSSDGAEYRSYPDGMAYWASIGPAPLQARFGHVGVWANGALFVWGGSSGGGFLSDGARCEVSGRRSLRRSVHPAFDVAECGLSKLATTHGEESRVNIHPCARTCAAGRELLVQRVRKLGWSATEAAAAAGVSKRTAYKWLKRFREEGVAGLRRPQFAASPFADQAAT